MKKMHFFQIILLVVIVSVSANCTKEAPATSTGQTSVPDNPPPPPPPPTTINTPPIADAGPDRLINLPFNTCLLVGWAYDRENNIQTILWRKISGPTSFFIENPDSLITKVKNMEPGVYQFELTVTDKMGLYNKDTVKVTVGGSSSNTDDIIFENLTWIPIWYETLEINSFYSFIPTGTPFRVYIQRDANPAWVEATPVATDGSGGAYEYFVETRPDGAGMYSYGSLYIFGYGTDFSDTPNVKIVF